MTSDRSNCFASCLSLEKRIAIFRLCFKKIRLFTICVHNGACCICLCMYLYLFKTIVVFKLSFKCHIVGPFNVSWLALPFLFFFMLLILHFAWTYLGMQIVLETKAFGSCLRILLGLPFCFILRILHCIFVWPSFLISVRFDVLIFCLMFINLFFLCISWFGA